MRIAFQSLAKADTVYTWHTEWDFLNDACRHGRPLSHHCGSFLTYGDGGTQHSHESAVQCHDAVDYLASLATHLAAHPEDAADVSQGWPRTTVILADVQFATAVKYKEKVQYYNVRERKVSTSESKRHDKRWEIVGDWCKGDFESAMRILAQGYLTTLDRYAKACELERLMAALGLWVEPKAPAEAVGIEDADGLWLAFAAINHRINAYRELETSARFLGALKERTPAPN